MKIKIGYKHYEVIEKEEDQAFALANGRRVFGTIDYHAEKIYINKAYANQMGETLIHEILHGVDDMYHLDMSEEFIRSLATALYTILMDNQEQIRQMSLFKNQ
ncbi:MAG: hypothetical protein Q4D65_09110 [Peptostreptococcaceae bacterium]|nr:hypothetical protein [Peptostreptococcaceae bacterium]